MNTEPQTIAFPTPTTVQAVAVIEGQRIPLPAEIAASDDLIRRALAPFYPDAANAQLSRAEQDGVLTVTVVKRAGSKGNLLGYLQMCPGGKNPVIALYEAIRGSDLAALDAYAQLELAHRVEQALAEGEAQGEAVRRSAHRLAPAAPQLAPGLLLGF